MSKSRRRHGRINRFARASECACDQVVRRFFGWKQIQLFKNALHIAHACWIYLRLGGEAHNRTTVIKKKVNRIAVIWMK